MPSLTAVSLASEFTGVGALTLFSVVEDVVDRGRETAFFVGLLGDEGLPLTTFQPFVIECRVGVTRAILRVRFSNGEKASAFKDRIEVSHLGQCFDPWKRTEFAASTDEEMSQSGASISGVQHDTGQCHQLPIQGPQRCSVPATTLAEKTMTLRECLGWGNEQTDANGLISMPEQKALPHQPEVVTAVMPPSEVRPVRFGRSGDPALVGNSFFLRSGADGSVDDVRQLS